MKTLSILSLLCLFSIGLCNPYRSQRFYREQQQDDQQLQQQYADQQFQPQYVDQQFQPQYDEQQFQPQDSQQQVQDQAILVRPKRWGSWFSDAVKSVVKVAKAPAVWTSARLIKPVAQWTSNVVTKVFDWTTDAVEWTVDQAIEAAGCIQKIAKNTYRGAHIVNNVIGLKGLTGLEAWLTFCSDGLATLKHGKGGTDTIRGIKQDTVAWTKEAANDAGQCIQDIAKISIKGTGKILGNIADWSGRKGIAALEKFCSDGIVTRKLENSG